MCTWQLSGSSFRQEKAARDIAIAVALTLSNQFHIDSRVEFLHCVVGTVLMLYRLAIEGTVLAAVTFIRYR